jgi:hypothetical protein
MAGTSPAMTEDWRTRHPPNWYKIPIFSNALGKRRPACPQIDLQICIETLDEARRIAGVIPSIPVVLKKLGG